MSLWEKIPKDCDFSVDNPFITFVSPQTGTRIICEDDKTVSWVVKMFQIAEGHGHTNIDVVYMMHSGNKNFSEKPNMKKNLGIDNDQELVDAGFVVNGYYKVLGSRKKVAVPSITIDDDFIVMVTPNGHVKKIDSDNKALEAVTEYRKLEESEAEAVTMKFIFNNEERMVVEIKAGDGESFFDKNMPTNSHYLVQEIKKPVEKFYGHIDLEDVWVYTPAGCRAKFDVDTKADQVMKFYQQSEGKNDKKAKADFYLEERGSGGKFEKKQTFELEESADKDLNDCGLPVNGFFLFL